MIQFHEVDAVSDGSLGSFELRPQKLGQGQKADGSRLTVGRSPSGAPGCFAASGPPSPLREEQLAETPDVGPQGGEPSGHGVVQPVLTLPPKGCTAERLDGGDDHSPISLNFHVSPQEQSSQPPQQEPAASQHVAEPSGQAAAEERSAGLAKGDAVQSKACVPAGSGPLGPRGRGPYGAGLQFS